jgi:hypothetical protein
MNQKKEISKHYENIWGSKGKIVKWDKGPIKELPKDFCVLEFAPTNDREMWAYATCCMSELDKKSPIEIHMFSPVKSLEVVEILTVVAHYHNNDRLLALNHTVNFGKPWLSDSKCDHGFVSLPYIDGPELENFYVDGPNEVVKFYWLIPVTKKEVDYVKNKGVEALEIKFEEDTFNYLDIHRKSVV